MVGLKSIGAISWKLPPATLEDSAQDKRPSIAEASTPENGTPRFIRPFKADRVGTVFARMRPRLADSPETPNVAPIREAKPRPKLLDQVRDTIRMRHYSRRTETTYVHWIRRFILFHHKKHPSTMNAPEIAAFLSWLATDQRVSSSTQNQALSAILFLYRHVLCIEVGAIDHVPRAKMPHRVRSSSAERKSARSSSTSKG
jgi:hypothetical protein